MLSGQIRIILSGIHLILYLRTGEHMSNLKKRLNDVPPCAWDEAYNITVMNDKQTEDLVNYPLHYNKGNIACI